MVLARRCAPCSANLVGYSGDTIARGCSEPRDKIAFCASGRSWVGGDEQLMRERSELFDPAPLFFPTEWNFSQRPLPAGMHKLPGQIFESFEANFTMGEQGMKLYGADAFATPERLGDILAQGNAGSFAGMGQLDPSHKALTQRSLSIEVVKLSNGKTVIFNQDNDLNPQGLNIKPMIFGGC